MAAKFSLNQRVFKGLDLLGHGLNDTTIPEQRQDGEFKTLENWDYLFPGSFIKCKGRLLINDDLSSRITGFIVSPVSNCLLEITTANQSLYFKSDGSYYTASVAPGKYYEHSVLSTALQTALNVNPSANKFAVSYSASTRKYTITRDVAIILCWEHPNTTLPKATFGFRWSVADAAAPYSIVSDFACPNPPAYNRFVTTADGKLYKISADFTTLTELHHADGTDITPSDLPWTGQFQNEVLHGSNSKESLVLRDNTQILKMLKNGLATVPYAQRGDAPVKPYHFVSDFANTVVLTEAVPYARLKIGSNAQGIQLIDTLTTKLRAYVPLGAGEVDCFDIEFYLEIPSLGYLELIDTVNGKDLSDSSAGDNYTITERWPLSTNAEQYILVKFVLRYAPAAGTPTLQIFGKNTSGSDKNVWLIDTNGAMVAQSFQWYGEVSMTSISTGEQTRKFRVSLVNEEGFETQLSDTIHRTITFTDQVWLTAVFIPTPGAVTHDIFAVRLYCTESDGKIFYRRIEVPFSWFGLSGSVVEGRYAQVFLLNMTDLTTYGVEADVLTVRDAPPPFKYSVVWQGRVWMVSDEYPNRLLWCDVAGDGQMIPESIDLAHNQMPIGKDQKPITGLCGFEDRLMVFKDMNPSLIVPSGNSWQQTELKGMGTLSHYSIRSFRSDDGAGFVWQGTDGHFYYSDGVVVTNLSQGRLEKLVGG